MRTDNLPQAFAAVSRIQISPDLRLGITPVREAGSVAPGLSAPLAAQAAGGSSSRGRCGHGDPQGPSPEQGGHCVGKCDRGVMPDASPESGVNRATCAADRTELVLSCVAIVLVIACALFDAPVWLGRAFVALGWA